MLIRLGLPSKKSIADLFFQSLNSVIMIVWGLYMLYKKKEPPKELFEGSPARKEMPWLLAASFFLFGISPVALQAKSQTSLPEAEPGNRDQKVADAP
jgi:uncharacterized membrane protein YfcA